MSVLLSRVNKLNIPNLEMNIKKLSQRELMYFNIMRCISGVLYVQGKPGISKTATFTTISEKIEINFLDVRLSMIDETDVGLYPDKIKFTVYDKDKNVIYDGNTLDHIVPKVFIEANSRPTLILFGELNRASLPVRNASLQILNERKIGGSFKFNNNVLMCADGNLGTDDNTDVDSFDSALWGRLVSVIHEMPATEWLQEFAYENVHPLIVGFIEANNNLIYNDEVMLQGDGVYTSHRSLTFLSDFLINNYSDIVVNDDKESIVLHDLNSLSESEINHLYNNFAAYIDTSTASKLLQYVKNINNITILDIMKSWISVKDFIISYKNNYASSKFFDLIHALGEIKLDDLNDNEIDNIISFLHIINTELLTKYLNYVLSNAKRLNIDFTSPKVKKIYNEFPNVVSTITKTLVDITKNK